MPRRGSCDLEAIQETKKGPSKKELLWTAPGSSRSGVGARKEGGGCQAAVLARL